MKIFGIMLLMIGALFAQPLDFDKVASPSDGLSYQFKDMFRNFGLFVADTMSAEGGIQARLMYKEELAQERAKEGLLGNTRNMARIEVREHALNQDIDHAYANMGTLQKERILQKIQAHEQNMVQLRERLPEQALTGFDNALQNLIVQQERMGMGAE